MPVMTRPAGRRLVHSVCVRGDRGSGSWLARGYAHGLSFVVRAADMQGTARRLADLDTTATRERELQIPTVRGPLRARALRTVAAATHRAALLVSGLHPAGIDEPRLVGLARHLSASGLDDRHPGHPELSRFEIAPAIADAIEQAGLWLSSDAASAPDRKVALMGISFGGGLSVVAAGPAVDCGSCGVRVLVGRARRSAAGAAGICARASSPRPGEQVGLRAVHVAEADSGSAVRPPTA